MMKCISILFLLGTALKCYSQKPQEPLPPYPYHTEEVYIENKSDSIKLAGTLTLPEKGNNFPVVLLLSGSGAQDRNSELLGHKPFLVLADYLTRNGIAVLRMDDRDEGQSGGVYNEAGVKEFTEDALYAINYLKSRKEINKSQIGLIGHSLGGIVAQVAAAKTNDVAFIVLMASPGIDGDKLMLLQKEVIERKLGGSDASITIGQQQIGMAYKIIRNPELDDEAKKLKLTNYLTAIYGMALPKQQIEGLVSQLSFPWFSDLIKYNPSEVLAKIKCPVLALNGSNDLQVVPSNLNAIEEELKKNGNTKVKAIEMPNLNHLFQESKTGLPNEYANIEQTLSPEVLKIIKNWIVEITK
ncbi:S9 family peptidase [Flavobacterium sp. MK4S-17]|uniref:alpha/beta hydrolase family protein n=1 Tax=Flavobacterium sp. MK4S-17 TaxID=2543737 RepID=UPI001F2DFF93|nr:alpha/beta fold hydrolase [Flavobacterium sp. MK4S-17]